MSLFHVSNYTSFHFIVLICPSFYFHLPDLPHLFMHLPSSSSRQNSFSHIFIHPELNLAVQFFVDFFFGYDLFKFATMNSICLFDILCLCTRYVIKKNTVNNKKFYTK